MDRVTLQPAAGAQGELAGIMMIRAYHEHRGERRRKVLVPDSAHGTNPASAALNGYEVVSVPSGEDGLLHPEAVEAAMSERRRRADDHQPEHARALRGAHRADLRDRPRQGRARLRRRRQPERRCSASRGPATSAST